jgi:hypothetical protein
MIGPGRILPVTPGAGTGTLDYLFFTFSNAERDNCPSPGDGGCAAFNGDNANTEVAGGGDTMFDESYVTSMGEIQDFYLFTFPPPMRTPDEIILFLDINEQGQDTMVDLCDLQIVTNYGNLVAPVDDPANNDVLKDSQNAIEGTFTFGTLEAVLDPAFSCPGSPLTLATSPGSGFADLMIFTGIDPFDYPADTPVLFYVEMDSLTPGGEEIFLSGGFFPFMVGGEIIPISSTPLLLSGIQTNAFFLLGTLSLVGVGAFATLYLNIKRKEKSV